MTRPSTTSISSLFFAMMWMLVPPATAGELPSRGGNAASESPGEPVLELQATARSDEKKKKKKRKKKRKRRKRKTIYHKVKRGETVSEIAADYDVRVKDIVRWNKLESKRLIRRGQKLKIKVDADWGKSSRESSSSSSSSSSKKTKRVKKPPKDGTLLEPGTRFEAVRKPTEGLTFTPKEGFVAPYSYDNLFRGFDGGNCLHQGLDIGGVGENYGVGTPIKAMVKAKVVSIGSPETNSSRFGKRDKRKGKEKRGGVRIPRRVKVDGYGTVYPFTRKNGSSRTGVIITTEAIGTEIEGYHVRYMHLAAVHPDLEVGDVVEAGQEIGLMGGTGFKNSPPHLHLDIEDPEKVRVDPAPFLGLEEVRPSFCKPIAKRKVAKKYRKKGKKRYRTHTVKKGETLGRIANKYGCSVKQIAKWNKIKNKNKIRRGQKLKIYR